MSSGRLDRSGTFSLRVSQGSEIRFSLTMDAVQVRRNGIEFRSPSPVVAWREMTVELEVGEEGDPLVCRGIVVSCVGDKYLGYPFPCCL